MTDDVFAEFPEPVRDRLGGLPPGSRWYVESFLTGLKAQGCQVEIPQAVRQDYVNLLGPLGRMRGRLASLHARSGRVEFQADTWPLAEGLGLAGCFSHVPAGDKCSIVLADEPSLKAAQEVATAILAGRPHG